MANQVASHPQADGGDQQKFDDGMRELRKGGIQVWPSPDVMAAGAERVLKWAETWEEPWENRRKMEVYPMVNVYVTM